MLTTSQAITQITEALKCCRGVVAVESFYKDGHRTIPYMDGIGDFSSIPMDSVEDRIRSCRIAIQFIKKLEKEKPGLVVEVVFAD